MLKFVTGGATALLLAGAAFSQSNQETLVGSCTEAGNDQAACECAAEMLIETLEDNELAFLMAVMDEDTNEPERVMAIAAENGLDMTGMMTMQQKMVAAAPEVSEQCGIEDMQ